MLFLVKKIPLWKGSVKCCPDTAASSFVAKVWGEVFSHFHAVAMNCHSSIVVASYDSQGYSGGILTRLHTDHLHFKSKLYYDRQSVGQSVLVSCTHLGPATNFSFSLNFSLDSCGFVIL
jgi:hypothetical protein